MNFTTLPNEKPKVGNTTLLSHGPTSAFVSYDILEDGGENITETGCYYELASQNATETQSEKRTWRKKFQVKCHERNSYQLLWRLGTTETPYRKTYSQYDL